MARKRIRRIDIFPDYTAREIVIGELSSSSNLTNVMAIIPYIDKKGMEYALVIQKALQRYIN